MVGAPYQSPCSLQHISTITELMILNITLRPSHLLLNPIVVSGHRHVLSLATHSLILSVIFTILAVLLAVVPDQSQEWSTGSQVFLGILAR